ncbi:hypothetical protein EJB05_04583, partial [Eragrostis curvula]
MATGTWKLGAPLAGALIQQLLKKLQNHAILDAEVARLCCLLVDIRGRIEGEMGAFQYQRSVKNIDLISSVDRGSFLVVLRLPTLVISDATIRCTATQDCQVL